MKKILIIFFLFLNSKTIMAQKCDCDISIPVEYYIDDDDNPLIIYAPCKAVGDTLAEKSNKDNEAVKIYFKNCKGGATIWKYFNNLLIAKGEFIPSLDTLKEYVTVEDFEGNVLKIGIDKYFEPLKDGTWFYYSRKGKILKTEIWDKGIKVN